MSIIDTNELTGKSLIVHFVTEIRNKGTFLPYCDMEVIDSWLDASNSDSERLLLLLHDHLPNFYQKYENRPFPPALRRIQNHILKKIKNVNK